jgi:hypothetical protein
MLRRAIASFVLCLALASGAQAQESSEDLIRRALALRAEDREEEAHPLLVRAFELSDTPRARAQLALSHQALGHWRQAYDGLRTALAADDPWITTRRAALEQALATVRGELAFVTVSGSPAGARVRIDDEEVGTLPISDPIPLDPGIITIEVRADGHASATRQLTIARGIAVDERVVLDPTGGGREASPVPWIVIGLSGAVAIGGAVMLGVGQADIAAIEGSMVGTPWSEVREAAERAVILSDVGIVAIAAGAIGIGIGIVLFFTDGGGAQSATLRDVMTGTIRF